MPRGIKGNRERSEGYVNITLHRDGREALRSLTAYLSGKRGRILSMSDALIIVDREMRLHDTANLLHGVTSYDASSAVNYSSRR